MAVDLSAAGGIFSSGVSKLAQLKWVFIVIMVLAALGGLIYWLRIANNKKKQWTHKFRVRRRLADGRLTPEVVHLARRFFPEKRVEMFELEKMLLGSHLCPQPGQYTGENEFNLVIDADNRIYMNQGEKFNTDTGKNEISLVHAGIDVTRQQMREKWESAHKSSSKITTAQLIAAGLKALGIVLVFIIAIIALQEWGDAQAAKAQVAQAEVEVMTTMNEVVETMEKVVNTQQLQIVPMLNSLYGKGNVASEVKQYCEVTPDDQS